MYELISTAEPSDLQLHRLCALTVIGGKGEWDFGAEMRFNNVFSPKVPHVTLVAPKWSSLEKCGPTAYGALVDMLKEEGFPLEDNLPGAGLDRGHVEKYVKMRPSCHSFYTYIESLFPGDFMAVPVRFDIQGLAPDDALEKIEDEHNYPIDPIIALSYLYTHHLALGEQVLWLDALGVEVSPDGNGVYKDSCYADRRGKKLVNFDWNFIMRMRSFRIAPRIVVEAIR